MLTDPSVEVNLINGDLLTFPLDTKYDRIISSLPLTNLPVDFVELFLSADDGAAQTGRRLQLCAVCSTRKDEVCSQRPMLRVRRLHRNRPSCGTTPKPVQFERTLVWRNVPPTWVYLLAKTN